MLIRSCSSLLRAAVILCGLALGMTAAVAAMCDVPSFSNVGGPLPLGEADVEAHVLVAGNFNSRPGERCDCDIAAMTVDAGGNRLQLLRGTDDGDFVPAQSVALAGRPIAAVKFGGSDDRDGIAVLQQLPDGGPGQLDFYVVDAGGRLIQGGASRRLGGQVTSLATSDFNSDGRPDLAVGASSAPRLTILWGAPGGGLESEDGLLEGLGPEVGHRVTGLAPGSSFGSPGTVLAVAVVSDPGELSVTFVGLDPFDQPESLAQTVVGAGHSLAIAAVRFPNDVDMLMAVTTEAGSTATGRLLRVTDLSVEDMGASFDRPPQSLAAADLNGDLFLDLVISSYGSQPSSPDARIHLLRGEPSGDFTSMLVTPPRDLHARGIVVGTFGRDPFSQPERHAGIAAVEDPPGRAIVYRGDGAGAFVRPSGFRTDLPHPDARIVVSADLHGDDGLSAVSDLGYVWFNAERNRFMFSVLLSTGNRGFFDPGQAISVGKEPLLFAAGRFDGDLVTDLAVIDANPDDVRRRPLLKLFRGLGNGRFGVAPGVSEYLLGEGEIPRGIVAGALAGGDGPMDITVVNTRPTGGSVLARFSNDGTGHFAQRFDALPLAFQPSAMFGSNRFRDGGRLDFILRGDHDNSFMLLRNAGDGEIVSHELIRDPDGTGMLGSGPPPGARRLFVVDLDRDGFDDLVGIDEDRSIDIFSGDGDGGFQFTSSDAIKSGPFFAMEGAQFFVDDFGAGRVGIAALVRSGLSPALLTLGTGDDGKFLPLAELELLEPPVGPEARLTRFERLDISNPGEITIAPLTQGFVGRFANPEHGSGLPDIGTIMSAGRIEVVPGQCPGDNLPNPGPEEVCVTTTTDPEPDAICMRQCPPNQGCIGGCQAATGMCRVDCGPLTTTKCHDEPRHPYCDKTAAAQTYLIVFGNTCSG